jgi:hypothetical protein
MRTKGTVCGPINSHLADACALTNHMTFYVFLPSPMHACPRYGPWAGCMRLSYAYMSRPRSLGNVYTAMSMSRPRSLGNLYTAKSTSLFPTSHNKPSTHQLQRIATEHFSTCKSHSHNRPSAYQLQRSATEHSSTCKSHSHKPQQT